jgi:hypothetical protein
MWEYQSLSAAPAANLPAVHRYSVPIAAPFLICLLPAVWWLALTLRRRWLRSHRAHLCPACGYDLRGGEGGTCPECGAARTANAASNSALV